MTPQQDKVVMQRLANTGKLELVHLESAAQFGTALLLVGLSHKCSSGNGLGAQGTAVPTPRRPLQPGVCGASLDMGGTNSIS